MKRLALALVYCCSLTLHAEEGMYPVTELQKLNLRKIGLTISLQDIYNPRGVSLIDAIVHLGGCTGSFVSPEGLILTNHHCAFGSVAAVSTPAHDYVTDGFLAGRRADEVPAQGQTVRLIESYRDVSSEVLAGITDTMELAARTRSIEEQIRRIVRETESAQPGRRAEVAEMFAGKSYVLFVSLLIRDVRLVYVPPRSVGEFGGEDDNWMWPRHTGDFSFLRAYVGPDGRPAAYSPQNVPYHPRKFLRVNPNGVDDGDLVFILGYPGRTFRHRTSHYLAYEESIRMPFVADLYEWQIATMQQLGKDDRAVALKHDAWIKGLANTSKNYRGKLMGMARLHLVAQKEAEEARLQQYIDADPVRKARAGTALADIAGVYREMSSRARSELVLDYLRPSSTLLNLAFSLLDATRELQKPDSERVSRFADRNRDALLDAYRQTLRDLYAPTQGLFLKKMFALAGGLPSDQRILPLDSALANDYSDASLDRFVDSAVVHTRLSDDAFVLGALAQSPEALEQTGDPFIRLARALEPLYRQLREVRQRREGALSKAMAVLVDMKSRFLQASFIPDANSTLRFTYGHVRGYSPADAVWYSPITTLRGVIEKTRDAEPYNTPARIRALAAKKEFGRFRHPKLNDVPVAILYDTDTTGGNSGSPVMNARGEMIGINFDRTFEATINDFAWSESYSRSIAVDIRYVLWVTEKVGGAGFLLGEMGVGNE